MNKQQKLVLIVSILASFVAFLDGSVVNVALPAIESDLGGGLPVQQWVVNAYLLTLGSFILVAGSLSDLFGRKRVLSAGLIGFGVASLLCAVAPNSQILIASRAMQGLFGAFIVPSSLALIITSFKDPNQGRAIGLWTAWTGISFLVGPLVGGVLVDAVSWRLVFAINVVPILITMVLMRRLNEKAPLRTGAKVDITGAALCSIGLGSLVYALIEQTNYGFGNLWIILAFLIGSLSLGIFFWHENRVKDPMLPLSLFKVRNFLVGNIATVSIYAGLSVATFLIVIFVQQIGGYTALQAGLSLLPVTLIMFALSPLFGRLASKYGPRLLMSAGPMVAGAGFLLMLWVDNSVAYWSQLFPGIALFGLGLSMTVAPLTTAVLADIKQEHAGVGSAVNNAVSRIAGLLATGAIGIILSANLQLEGFKKGVITMAVLLFIGGVVSAIGIRNSAAAMKRANL